MYTTTIAINNPEVYIKSPHLLREDVLTRLCAEAEAINGTKPGKDEIDIISGFPELLNNELLPFKVEWEIIPKV
ncbi:hypothetical protein AHMF7605_05660 [Adhaeribacter arboris]|uniref:Uncharacterized protein n=1 Tax=Adhaeribacter arboris TaxID=2072846 RepID=A0A2T2YC06_9BACT|nr:hypothetical protein [Adhaeribacter arboris]PSR53047.1 hypothetical protein AHMF7605_05660 [Adhaeribacter arboris]